MKTCPSCKRESQDAGEECPYCGLIYAKWEARRAMEAANPEPLEETEPEEQEEENDLQKLLVGLAIFSALTIYMYIDLTQWEASGDGARTMNWFLAIMYNLFGKWGIVGLMGFILGVGSLKAIQMLATGERSLR